MDKKYLFENEDDTLGNLLRLELLDDPTVYFAGYRVPHPLERTVELRIKTHNDPNETVIKAIDSLLLQVNDLEVAFNKSIKN